MSTDEEQKPRWELIDKRYEEIDKILMKTVEEDKMFLLERDMLLTMIERRFEYIRLVAWFGGGSDGTTSNDNHPYH